TTTNDAEVWKWNGTTWSQIGGDALNSGWTGFQTVPSMAVLGGNLYVGIANATNAARVYRWNGTAWTWVGGFGITGGTYNAFTTGYESLSSMAVYKGKLYVGFGTGS